MKPRPGLRSAPSCSTPTGPWATLALVSSSAKYYVGPAKRNWGGEEGSGFPHLLPQPGSAGSRASSHRLWGPCPIIQYWMGGCTEAAVGRHSPPGYHASRAPAAFGSHNTPQFHAHTAPIHRLVAHSAGGRSSVTPLTTSACPPFFEVALEKGTPVLSQRTQGEPPSLPALSSLHPFSAWPPNTSPCPQPDLTMSWRAPTAPPHCALL